MTQARSSRDDAIQQDVADLHKLGTSRPVRNRVRGLDPNQYPGRSTVYDPITALPMETLAELFVHPAGYCQNVLATGRCTVTGTTLVGGREAIVLECDHPRTIEMSGDRPDHRIVITVDRQLGVILRLVESFGETVTRDAEVTDNRPDAPLPPTAFAFTFPTGTTMLY